MKIKCPNCNKPVSTYVVGNKAYCSLCDCYIQDVDPPAANDPVPLHNEIPPAEPVPEPLSDSDNEMLEEPEEAISDPVQDNKAKRKSIFPPTSKMPFTKKDSQMDALDMGNEEDPSDKKSTVNVNEDGFYDDVLPEIKAEYERLPKEIVLKSAAAVVGLIGAIIFLIFYF